MTVHHLVPEHPADVRLHDTAEAVVAAAEIESDIVDRVLEPLEMIARVKELNAKWEAEGKKPIAIGVGVNTGTVIFGNIGKGKKMEFTVIGDAVNLTARLESLNKEFSTSGASSPRKLPTEIQRKLAACQPTNGRTCRDSQRISEGIHEIMQFRGLKTTNSSSAEVQQRSARKGRHSILPLVCSQTRQLGVISPPLLRMVQSVHRFRVRKWDRQRY